MAKLLNINWKLHCVIILYRPQSPVKIERISRTLQETLTKLVLEAGEKGAILLPALSFSGPTVFLTKKRGGLLLKFLFCFESTLHPPQSLRYSPGRNVSLFPSKVLEGFVGSSPGYSSGCERNPASLPSKHTHQRLWKCLMLSLEFITPNWGRPLRMTTLAGLLPAWHTN